MQYCWTFIWIRQRRIVQEKFPRKREDLERDDIWCTTSWVHDAVMYICKVFMFLITLTVLVMVNASDIVMINHVLHDYAERVSNAAWHHSMWLYWCTTSWVHDTVMYEWIVYTSSIINRIIWSFTPPLHSYDAKVTKWNLQNNTFGTRITKRFLWDENATEITGS